MKLEDMYNACKVAGVAVTTVSELAGFERSYLSHNPKQELMEEYYELFKNALAFAIKQKKEKDAFLFGQRNLKEEIDLQICGAIEENRLNAYCNKILDDVDYWESINADYSADVSESWRMRYERQLGI